MCLLCFLFRAFHIFEMKIALVFHACLACVKKTIAFKFALSATKWQHPAICFCSFYYLLLNSLSLHSSAFMFNLSNSLCFKMEHCLHKGDLLEAKTLVLNVT